MVTFIGKKRRRGRPAVTAGAWSIQATDLRDPVIRGTDSEETKSSDLNDDVEDDSHSDSEDAELAGHFNLNLV